MNAGSAPGGIGAPPVRPTGPVIAFLLALLSLLPAGCSAEEPKATIGPVDWVWAGAITDSSAEVRAKLTRPFKRARLGVSPSPAFDSVAWSRTVITLPLRKDEVYVFPLAGLRPGTRYHYRIEVDGRPDTASAGRFRTFPAGPASFRLAFASCARTGSTHPVFDRILSLDPLFFLHLGDFHYEDIASTDPDQYRRAYDRVLRSPVQRRFFRSLPVAYVWDDHDFGGDNSDSTSFGRDAVRKIYREYVPHWPLPDRGTINQAFTVGRVRFLLTDSRSARSPRKALDDGTKTLLGRVQKAWLKDELRAAKGTYPLIVWANSVPWIGAELGDDWSRYAAERREIADFVKAEGVRLCMLSGDAHMLAIDDGSHAGYASSGGGGFPVFHAAPLDRDGSVKGGPYSHGPSDRPGQFGLMEVEDAGGDEVTVRWRGMDHAGATVMSHAFTVPARGPAAKVPPYVPAPPAPGAGR